MKKSLSNIVDLVKYPIHDLQSPKIKKIIEKCKTDFGGVHIDLNDSYNNAKKFIYELKENLIAKHLDAGNSLES